MAPKLWGNPVNYHNARDANYPELTLEFLTAKEVFPVRSRGFLKRASAGRA
ncbi:MULTISPECIES: hypothetical protein [unclassified Rhizobium]|uniref:hypothetical protein n=1 Tax=unclassified Rhizobium TaxID=2613769 RepID=UPI001C835B1C|nr:MULTISPECIES: hypothetical protein [unclassified Rhizobium]MBX5166920.1 hypothetical protein [Rhizobium sp. NZLR4b]MBX5172359.1 hypothetical protein [Rhizobium sp. NZLR1b]MBX5198037.1 hypothetical protein [Rhizobium sp. NZLR10]MBX5211067.1 hypothetical protein [Rhizobium sp. NZLR11]